MLMASSMLWASVSKSSILTSVQRISFCNFCIIWLKQWNEPVYSMGALSYLQSPSSNAKQNRFLLNVERDIWWQPWSISVFMKYFEAYLRLCMTLFGVGEIEQLVFTPLLTCLRSSINLNFFTFSSFATKPVGLIH